MSDAERDAGEHRDAGGPVGGADAAQFGPFRVQQVARIRWSARWPLVALSLPVIAAHQRSCRLSPVWKSRWLRVSSM